MNYAEILGEIITYLFGLIVCLKTNCNDLYSNRTNFTTMPSTFISKTTTTTTTTTTPNNNLLVLDKKYLTNFYGSNLSFIRLMDLSNRSFTKIEANTFFQLEVKQIFLQNNKITNLIENKFVDLDK